MCIIIYVSICTLYNNVSDSNRYELSFLINNILLTKIYGNLNDPRTKI